MGNKNADFFFFFAQYNRFWLHFIIIVYIIELRVFSFSVMKCFEKYTVRNFGMKFNVHNYRGCLEMLIIIDSDGLCCVIYTVHKYSLLLGFMN